MRHQDLVINHILESWSFANTTARNSATPPGGGTYVSADIGRIGYQQDTGRYWRLTATTPAWQAAQGVYTMTETPNTAPASTTSTTMVMMGMGSTVTFTPTGSGKALVIANGGVHATSVGAGGQMQMYYGITPGAPANGAALTGTAVSGPKLFVNPTGQAGATFPITLVGLISNLTPGTTYWFDIALSANSGSSNLAQTNFDILELP